ncbi:MAG: hypothetical protein AUJ07_08135 [Crenarchaeota archaeon 13_1_40CM_3_53_5]|nr:MAG: hypothetical protein AUJ07_08135 [Crenarchaeota archaeon 13_1_40CM_3_53_5]
MARFFKPGVSSASKMQALMGKCARESMQHHGKELNEFLRFAGEFEYLAIKWHEPKIHYKVVVGDISFKGSDILAKRAVDLALRHDASGLLVFDLWRELGQAVRSLLICNYESVPRSLRWMIEASAFWADMQLDAMSAHEWFEMYYKQRSKINENEYRRLFDEIYSTSSARFEERLFLKEKYRRPRLGEVLDNLKLSIAKPANNLDPGAIKRNLRKLYSEFSESSHVTLRTVRELYYEYLHGDFAFYQDYIFDKEESDQSMRSMWMTLDSVLALIILTEAEFLGYETPRALVQALEDRNKKQPPLVDKKVLRQRLPLLSTLLSGQSS